MAKAGAKAKAMSKASLVQALTKQLGEKVSKRDVKSVIESLTSVAHKELKKAGIFVVPGLTKVVVVKKPATKERQGINPFTKQPMLIPAKPARRVLRARPVGALKKAVL